MIQYLPDRQHNRVDVRRLHLSLRGMETPHSNPLRHEVESAGWEAFGVSRNEMPGASTTTFWTHPELPNQTTTCLELSDNSTSCRPFYADSQTLPRSVELGTSEPAPTETDTIERTPLELENEELQPRVTDTVWRMDQTFSQSAILELAVPNPSPMSNHLGTTSRRVDAPEAIPGSALGQSSNLTTERFRTFSTNPVQRRRLPVVTFYCERFTSCGGYCSCICHSKYHYKSPNMLKRMIGSLFIGYTCLPMLARKCNLDSCMNRQSCSIRVSYTFPTWLVMKALELIAVSSSMTGPSFGLSLRNRIDLGAGANIISSAINGDITMMVKLLEKHKAALTDIDSMVGQSPFYVGTWIFTSLYSKFRI